MSIDLRHIRYAIAAADHGSFRQAARMLGVQGSALSRRIRDLEDQSGASLFIRHKGGVATTYAGRYFVEQTRRAVEQIERTQKYIGASGRGENGIIRIGLNFSIGSSFLSEIIKNFCDKHSAVKLEFFEGILSEQLICLRDYRLDVVFMMGLGAIAGHETLGLWREDIYVAMPAGHELQDYTQVEWQDLRQHPLVVSDMAAGPAIVGHIIEHVMKLGHSPRIEHQMIHLDTLMQIVACNRGLTLVNESMSATQFPGVIYRRLVAPPISFQAVWSATNDNPPFRRFLSLARATSNVFDHDELNREPRLQRTTQTPQYPIYLSSEP
ncbi:LysR family transcriptional regulator [Labrys sp. La1]|uniref:LysR family transcriptional regulator n=1 Tax=Labrys sp. La1 TaxID=3404917 RepID=UPI003EBA07FA